MYGLGFHIPEDGILQSPPLKPGILHSQIFYSQMYIYTVYVLTAEVMKNYSPEDNFLHVYAVSKQFCEFPYAFKTEYFFI
jgi:hypothetical protein